MMWRMPVTTPALPGPYVRLRAEPFAERAKALGLESDAQIADKLGLDRAGVYRVRDGQSNPGERFIAAAIKALDAKFEDLFEIAEAS